MSRIVLLIFLCTVFSASSLAEKLKSNPIYPAYSHDYWQTKATCLLANFSAYISCFDGQNDNDSDGVGDVLGVPLYVAYEMKPYTKECIKTAGRPSNWITDTIWLNKELKIAIIDYRNSLTNIKADDRVIRSERGKQVSAQTIVNIFWSWYRKLGFVGASSHSGRRTFITNAARKISTVGGSIKDVQMLARHSSLSMTQKYIEADVEAQKKIVQII